ncbi:MAG: PrsW family glutamic-type intramembrane protease [candidate division WOR-3 bacterium]
MIVLLLLIALAPGIFLAWYFYHRDSYEPEPKLKIVKIFFLGALMVVPAALAEMLLVKITGITTQSLFHIFIISFIIIAPIEEILKYCAVRRWIYNSLEFDEAMDGIVYTVSASLGFATAENVMYVVSLGIGTGITRAFLAIPGHALFGALMGAYIGRAKFNPIKETRLLTTGVVLAIFCHGLYDFLALTRSAFSSLIILLLGILVLWTRRQLKKAERESRLRADHADENETQEEPAEEAG